MDMSMSYESLYSNIENEYKSTKRKNRYAKHNEKNKERK